MRLNKKHNIPFLSVWKHKDGGLYKALKVIQASPNGSNKIDLVWCDGVRSVAEVVADLEQAFATTGLEADVDRLPRAGAQAYGSAS